MLGNGVNQIKWMKLEGVLSGTQWTEEPEISLKSQNQLEWIGQTKPESFENIDWKF